MSARSGRLLAGIAVAFCWWANVAVCTEAPGTAAAAPGEQTRPRIARIAMGTIAALDLKRTREWYTQWLGYSVVEEGKVGAALAKSWGAPGMAGRPYILMRPESGDATFIRAVKSDDVPGYAPMTTFGWNSFEIIVADVYALDKKLKGSPFKIIGGPASLGNGSTIHAMQVIGPSHEVLYLTQETSPTATLLPKPGSFVGRPFILVLAGPDVAAIGDFYSSRFGIEARKSSNEAAIGIIARAQGLPEDHKFKMGFMRFGEHGHYIELDGYPPSAKARPRKEGLLPPGNAMATFIVDSLDRLDVRFITPPVREQSMGYAGHRSATFNGPAGELTELIESAE